MITLFRKFRKSLIQSSNTRKYLIYALGEISLVVIGILIALQVNNWNEGKKQLRTEHNYLQRLQIDLDNNILILMNKLQTSEEQQKAFKSFIQELYQTQRSKDDISELLKLVTWHRKDLILENRTYTELISTGMFSNMHDGELKELIRDYYIQYEKAGKHISEMNETGGEMFLKVYPKFIKYYDDFSVLFKEELMYREKDWVFLNNHSSEEFNSLESSATFYYYKETVFEKYYMELLQMAQELLLVMKSK